MDLAGEWYSIRGVKIKQRISTFCSFAVTAFVAVLASGDVVENSLGMRMIRLDGGRYVQGSSGGENGLANAFPLHINAQFFGKVESP